MDRQIAEQRRDNSAAFKSIGFVKSSTNGCRFGVCAGANPRQTCSGDGSWRLYRSGDRALHLAIALAQPLPTAARACRAAISLVVLALEHSPHDRGWAHTAEHLSCGRGERRFVVGELQIHVASRAETLLSLHETHHSGYGHSR